MPAAGRPVRGPAGHRGGRGRDSGRLAHGSARARQAAYLLGVAVGAHRIAVEYAPFRQQFGIGMHDLPAVSFPLARAMVALRATRAAVCRGAWLIGSEPDAVGTAPVMALVMAAETARDVVRLSMHSCGVRATTSELGLHRYFGLTAAESARYGDPAALWRTVDADRMRAARRAAADRELPVAATTHPGHFPFPRGRLGHRGTCRGLLGLRLHTEPGNQALRDVRCEHGDAYWRMNLARTQVTPIPPLMTRRSILGTWR